MLWGGGGGGGGGGVVETVTIIILGEEAPGQEYTYIRILDQNV